MPQPTGPHAGGAPPPLAPPRVAAGRDIRRDTSAPPQAGHFTSASSERRTMSSSNCFSHLVQAYS